MGPCSGIVAIELGDFQTAPGAGAILGDFGADVIKIEDPVRGDTFRGLYSWSEQRVQSKGRHIGFETSNRSKRGITLNLKHDKGREIFYKLIDKADVFYTNYREKVLRQLGADYETLSARKPSLIYGVVNTFGSRGSWAERRGYDFLAQARSGMMWAMGDRDTPEPTLIYGSFCDETAATMLAFGLVTALFARERYGTGQKVECSMYGSMIHIQSAPINITSLMGRSFARHSRTRVREPLTNYYKCADGKWILLCEVRGDEYWPSLARALGLNEFENDPRYAKAPHRRENYRELIQILDEAFAKKNLQEWLDIFHREGLDEAGFSYSPVFTHSDVLNDAQALENEYIIDFDHPTFGRIKVVGYPIKFSATPARVRCASPEHGQHTEEVLIELLGYSWEDIPKLRDEGVI